MPTNTVSQERGILFKVKIGDPSAKNAYLTDEVKAKLTEQVVRKASKSFLAFCGVCSL